MLLHAGRGLVFDELAASCDRAQQLATEAAKHARRENEFSGHAQLRIAQGPPPPFLSPLLLDKIHGYRTPIANDVVEKKPRNLDGQAPIHETIVFVQVTAQNQTENSPAGIGFTDSDGFLEQ